MSGEAGGGYYYPDSDDETWESEPCSWCDGQPWAQECADPLQCGCDGFHCSACANTGLAKYQTVW